MAFCNANTIVAKYEHALTQERNGDVALFYVHRNQDFAWLDIKDSLFQQMEWSKQAKARTLKIFNYNNKEATDDKGNKWYFLVVQPYINGEMAECNIDPFGLFILGELVSGYVYAFRKEKDRDGCHQAVMAFIPKPMEDRVQEKAFTETDAEIFKKTIQKKEPPKKMTPQEKEDQKKKQAELDALCENIGDMITELEKEKPKTKKQLDAERTREANRIKKEEQKHKQEWEHRFAESAVKKYEVRVAKQQEIERKKAKAKSVQGM